MNINNKKAEFSIGISINVFVDLKAAIVEKQFCKD